MNTTQESFSAVVRQEWTAFRSRGRVIALVAASLVAILFGLLVAYSDRSTCSEGEIEVACPTNPVGPRGEAVSDQFSFAHRTLGRDGSITARVTSMTGTITYPPPNHDEIVPGLVPWAKAGLIIKDGVTQGSSYAALMVTGANGVRMQHDYVHDTAGSPGGVSPRSPRWLRLTRSGDTITGHESTDGARWTQVGVAHLAGLPETVQVGLFAASPGDLTLKPIALGASSQQVRFTQAVASFDNVALSGAPQGEWLSDALGDMGTTDWEKHHQAAGLVTADGTFTVTGSGDIGPIGPIGAHAVEDTLIGLPIGLIIVLIVAVRRYGSPPLTRRVLAAKAVVIGAAGFLTGLVAAGVALPLGVMTLRANGGNVLPVSTATEVRVVVVAAGLVAVTAVFAFLLGALFRRAWVAATVAIGTVVIPYVLAGLPLLPDAAADWLLRLTPAAGFGGLQTLEEFPQVVAHYAPPAGYFPLSGWAGVAVLCGFTAAVLGLVLKYRSVTLDPNETKTYKGETTVK